MKCFLFYPLHTRRNENEKSYEIIVLIEFGFFKSTFLVSNLKPILFMPFFLFFQHLTVFSLSLSKECRQNIVNTFHKCRFSFTSIDQMLLPIFAVIFVVLTFTIKQNIQTKNDEEEEEEKINSETPKKELRMICTRSNTHMQYAKVLSMGSLFFHRSFFSVRSFNSAILEAIELFFHAAKRFDTP